MDKYFSKAVKFDIVKYTNEVKSCSLSQSIDNLLSDEPHKTELSYCKEKVKSTEEWLKNNFLTTDEIAAIHFFAEDIEKKTKFYESLNRAIRTTDINQLNPFLYYLKLILSALSKIETKKFEHLYCGQGNVIKSYPVGRVAYMGFSSFTEKFQSAYTLMKNNHKGEKGCIFHLVSSQKGKMIAPFSRNEQEILMQPALYEVLKVKEEEDYYLIDLSERISHFDLMFNIPMNHKKPQYINFGENFKCESCLFPFRYENSNYILNESHYWDNEEVYVWKICRSDFRCPNCELNFMW